MHFTKTKKLFIALSCLCLPGMGVQAQNVPASGTVKNEKGAPIEAVSVSIYGTGKGTLTDSKGNFSLSAPPQALLVFTYVGFDTVQARPQANMQVFLRMSGSSLNDVIIIGYGTAKRKEVTGSISTVGSKDFQQGIITTPEQLIAGKVAGVSITSNSGSPGAGSTIRIRGG